jgi:hypothetical protein
MRERQKTGVHASIQEAARHAGPENPAFLLSFHEFIDIKD